MTTSRSKRRMARLLRCGLGALIALLALALGAGATLAGERWSDLDGYKLSEVTLIGSHNTFETSHYRFLPDSLQHSQVIELDVYAQPGEYQFIVSHENMVSNRNNCYKPSGDDEGTRDQDIKSCIENLWRWHQRFPDHPLVIVKIEPKTGFLGNSTAEELDKQISSDNNPRIPRENIFRPVDLLTRPDGSRFATLDEAARANNWPTMAELRGKFMFQIVPGATQEGVCDFLTGDKCQIAPKQYGGRLVDGRVDDVIGFPTFFIFGQDDPRGDTFDDWVVTFDVQAGRLIENGGIDTYWLYTRHYLLSATASDGHRESVGMSREEFARYLSSHYKVSVVSPDPGDWPPAPTRIYAMVRGQQAAQPGTVPPFESSAGLRLRHTQTDRCLVLPNGGQFGLAVGTCAGEPQARHGTRASAFTNSVVFRDNGQIAIGGYCLTAVGQGIGLASCAPFADNSRWIVDAGSLAVIRAASGAGCLGADANGVVRFFDCADPAAQWERQGFSDLAGRYQIASSTLNRCWSVAAIGAQMLLDDCAVPATPGIAAQIFRHDPVTGWILATRDGATACLQIVDEDPGEIYDVPPSESNDAWVNGHPVRLAACDPKLASQRFAYSTALGRWLGVHGQCLGAYTAPLAGETKQRVFAFVSCAPEGRAFRADGGDGVRNLWAARQVPDATTITAVSGQGTYGGAVTLTATLTRTEGNIGPVAGQTVTFALPGGQVGTATTNAQGIAITVVSLGSVGAGSYPNALWASYAGNAALAPSGGQGPLTMDQAQPTVAVAAGGDTVVGQWATFTATVNGPSLSLAVPNGSVTFYDGHPAQGGTPIGGPQALDVGGRASVSSAVLAVGSHTIHVAYSGDTNYTTGGASAAHTVNKAATVTALASSLNPSFYGQPVTLTATVGVVAPGIAVPGGSVTFYTDGTSLGSAQLSGGIASLTVANIPGGSTTLTATYGGDAATNASISAPLIQVVTRVDTTTAATSGTNPSVYGQPITLTATVSTVPSGVWTPGGSVTFADNGVILGSAPMQGGQASLTITNLAVGSHTIVATYGGDDGANGSTSPALTQAVQKASTATTLAATPNPAAPGQAVTFTATVGVVAPGAGSPTGAVTFTDGAIVLGTSPVGAGGVASFTTSGLAVGTHPIVATYGGDGNLNGSASQPLAQQVTYSLCLLYDPTKAVKSGATIPLKVQLCDGAGGNLSAANLTLHATGVVQTSTNAPGTLQSPGNANPDNNFRFDPTLDGTGGYIFNFKTTGLATGTYTLTFTVTGDPLPHTVQFQVR